MKEGDGRFEVDLSRSSGQIFADRRALIQVLTNLICNSIKYARDSAHVTIAALDGAQGVTLSVVDKGVGMSEAELRRATQPFERLSDPQIADHGGTGLGLSIVNSLVKLHGGTLDIESRKGLGCTVRAFFPSANEYKQPQQSRTMAV